MCVGYPELCCSPSCMQSGGSPLSPVPVGGKNVSLDAINAVLTEITAITFDEFVHLGGDEVSQGCWCVARGAACGAALCLPRRRRSPRACGVSVRT